MKTEQKLEIYRELFGSLPEAPEGKELVGVECRAPKEWEIYYSSILKKWLKNVAGDYLDEDRRMVAIFKDTHRADGTPLSIDPLPEPQAGYRVEYIHISDLVSGEENCDRMWRFCPDDEVWEDSAIDNPYRSGKHYARLFKIAQPTTLADLVGKHGQNNVWIILSDNHQKAQALVCVGEDDSFDFSFAGESKSIETLERCGARWSNDPFTKYEDAKKFVV